jgi:NAD(P)-dependent dehydrogenase (short-subunit alcohol dehydrogenase family)
MEQVQHDRREARGPQWTEFCARRALIRRGARKVYGCARDPGAVTEPGLIPVRLDVTDPAEVAAVAELATDVTLLVNNAGINRGGSVMDPETAGTRADFETNFFGTASMSRSFAPILGANGGGTILNVLSALSFVSFPRVAGAEANMPETPRLATTIETWWRPSWSPSPSR